MTIVMHTRVSKEQVKIIDSLIRKGIFRSRTRAVETFIQEGLEKRGLIKYDEVYPIE